MKATETIRKAPIKINQQVVRHLSLGLYRNFALAIKELISNSYDAGATEVKIKLDLRSGKIIIRDNGKGMDEAEFKEEYLHIGYPKPPSTKPDGLGRMRIGTFGIGFLAPLPYCKVLRIITKKKGQEEALEAIIPADDFFTKGNWEIKDRQIEYKVYESDLPLKEGETIIVLEEIRQQIRDELHRETNIRRTIEGSGQQKFKWTLAQYCPIEFPPSRKDLRSFFEALSRVPMKLWVDGDQLYRNVPNNAQVLEEDTKRFGAIESKYVILTPYEPVQPEEMRGLQLRLKEVAIGFPRDFDVTKLGRVLGKLNMLCGEVHILSGLDDALLVNRDSFNFTEDVAAMYDFFRSRLTYWDARLYDLAEDDKELYLALGELREDKRILDNLTESKLLHFSKERVRLSEKALQGTRGRTVQNPVDRVVNVLQQNAKGNATIVRRKGNVNPKTPAIQLAKNTRTITVYEDHPAFIESIEFDHKRYKVEYDTWEPSQDSYSICRLRGGGKTIVFNKAHPLFGGRLNERIVKQLALGTLVILGEAKGKEVLIGQFNRLLEDAFGDK